MRRVGRIGDMLLLETIITVIPQQVCYTAALQLHTLYTERHTRLYCQRQRVLHYHCPHNAVRAEHPEFRYIISLLFVQIVCDLCTAALLVYKSLKVNPGMQITIVQQHLLYIRARRLGKAVAIYHRFLTQTAQHTVSPLCRVEPRERIGIHWHLQKAEPLGIRFLPDIILGFRSIVAVRIRYYIHIIEQILALGNKLFHRAREQQHHAQKRKKQSPQQCHFTQITDNCTKKSPITGLYLK